MAEINKKSVLIECLEYERGLWKLCSEGYDTLTPMKGMEDKWQEQRQKCEILADMIRAIQCEIVEQALAEWQKETMEKGPSQLKLDGDEPGTTL